MLEVPCHLGKKKEVTKVVLIYQTGGEKYIGVPIYF